MKINRFAILLVFTASCVISVNAIGHRNGKLLFTRSVDIWADLYTMNLNGTGLTRLSGPGNVPVDKDGAWSPDGRKIAFARSGFNDLPDIFLMNPDGSGLVQLTDGGPHTNYEQSIVPAWSPDGERIAFLGTRNGENVALYVMNSDGSNLIRIRPEVYCCIPPSWSPDGRYIAFNSWEGIQTIDLTNGNVRTLVSYVWYDWEPIFSAWSPDGSTIAYIQFPYHETEPEGEDYDLFLVNTETLQRRNLTNTPNFYEACPAWLPDGTGLVYSRRVAAFNSHSAIYSISADGNGTTQLTFPDGVSDDQPTVQPILSPQRSDFDGDGRADVSVFRPSDATWYLQQSTAGFGAANWGLATDKIVPADYDGDGKTDVAVYRPHEGNWYALRSSDGTLLAQSFGITEDLPVPADFDSDGKADIAVYRPSTGSWWINRTTGRIVSAQFGSGEDKPVVSDYNGDGRADLAVFRPSNATWYYSSDLIDPSHNFVAVPFGLSTDLTTPADFDGDGKADVAVYRPSSGTWFWINSTNGSFGASQFGTPEDIPTAADFDGDGRADVSVFRPSSGVWYRLNSGNGSFFAAQFGTNGDRPTPAAFRY